MNKLNDLSAVEKGRRDSDVRPRRRSVAPQPLKGIYMDEAISKTKFGIFNYIVIFVSGLVLNAVSLETCSVAFIIPVSQCDLHFTAAQKGILGAVAPFGIICSSHLWGFLADTKGRRRVIQPTLFLAFFTTIISSFVENFYLFATLRFLNGFLISGSSATIFAYLSEFHSDAYRSRAIMAASCLYGIACLFLPLVAFFFINQDWQLYISLIGIIYKPWRFFLVVCSIPGLLAALIMIFLPESPKFVLGQGDKGRAYEILEKMHRVNNGRKAAFESFEISEELDSIENRRRIMKNKESQFPLLRSVWIQTAPLFQRPHVGTTILICVIQFGIFATSTGFYMFFTEILNKMATNLDGFFDQRMMMCDIINMKPTNISAVEFGEINDQICITKLELATLQQGIILEVLYALGSVLIGLFINKIGKFLILFFILMTSGAGGVLCMLSDIPVVQVYSFIALMCSGLAANIVSAATVDLYPTTSRAMAVCISLMMGRLGSVVGANVSALLLDNSCEAAFYLAGFSTIAVGVLTYFIPNIHKNVDTEMLRNDPRLSVISYT